MEVKAKAKYIRMSPRKIRLIANIIRKMPVIDALNQLKFLNKKATEPVMKLLKSAIANAEHNYELDQNNLFVKEITVNEGPTIHRWLPRAHGRATPIRRKNSHINLILDEIKASGKVKPKKQELEAPIKLAGKPKEESAVKISTEKDKEKEKIEVSKDEKGKVIVNPAREGRVGHNKIEGASHKGFVNKIFRRKSG